MNLTTLDPLAVALGTAVASLLLAILFVLLWVGQRRLLKRYRLLLGGPRGRELDHLLVQQAGQIAELQGQLAALQTQVQGQAEAALGHIQHLGLVRFQAFPDMGSDLSFSAALLDAHQNGLVITSLFGRSESRIYGKPIRNGTSTYTLTDEEKQAIARAQGR